jgi:hypothetical protein
MKGILLYIIINTKNYITLIKLWQALPVLSLLDQPSTIPVPCCLPVQHTIIMTEVLQDIIVNMQNDIQ